MADNPYVNKVVYGDQTLIDLTDTTADASDVASGKYFYNAAGARTLGTSTPVQSDWNETDSTSAAYIQNKPDINELKVLVVTLASFSSLPQTFYETAVTADHVCIKAELGTPSAQAGDWTVTTSTGELTISGSISGSTTATLYFAIKQ